MQLINAHAVHDVKQDQRAFHDDVVPFRKQRMLRPLCIAHKIERVRLRFNILLGKHD